MLVSFRIVASLGATHIYLTIYLSDQNNGLKGKCLYNMVRDYVRDKEFSEIKDKLEKQKNSKSIPTCLEKYDPQQINIRLYCS